MALLLEINDGFDSVFGNGRGVSAEKAQARDSEYESAQLLKLSNPQDLAHLLCNPLNKNAGRKIVEEVLAIEEGSARAQLILDKLQEGDFAMYAKENEATSLKSAPHVAALIELLADHFLTEAQFDDFRCNTLTETLNIPYINATVRAKERVREHQFRPHLANQLFGHCKGEMSIEGLNLFAQYVLHEYAVDELVHEISQYNTSNHVHGRYLNKVEWRSFIARWQKVVNEQDLHTADEALLTALKAHGAKDIYGTRCNSLASKLAFRNFKRLSKRHRELSDMLSHGTSHLSFRKANKLRAGRKQILSQFEAHSINFLPGELRK